jgi:PPM family protein phosphatase
MYRGYREELPAGAAAGAFRYNPSQSSMDVEFTQLSDPGRVRSGNEDYLGHVLAVTADQARSHGWLFVLADGVGGHDLGEIASRTAVESLRAAFREAPAGETPSSLLGRLVRAANAHVIDAGRRYAVSSAAMATTLVACLLRFDRAVVAHVGDSRCYLVRRGTAKVLTHDHTVANDHARLGLLSAEEAADAPTRHVLTRSLGSESFVHAEISDHQVFPGDVLVLCSDGLHGSVSPSEIAAIAGQGGDLAEAARKLVDIANQRDGSDNISVQLIRVRSVERVGMYRGRPYRLA